MTSTVFHRTIDDNWVPLAAYQNEFDAEQAISTYWSKLFPYAQLSVKSTNR